MQGSEMFYINADGQKDDADIHQPILSREGLPPEEPPRRDGPLMPKLSEAGRSVVPPGDTTPSD